jgi:hypothetical protein
MSTGTEIPLRCACGTLRGVALAVSPESGCRVVCYCDDCQAFARFLAQPNILDQWGGTDIFQMAPSRVRITEGEDALACVRLSEKGLHRWYCGQCKTPVGNTVSARIPFVGLIHSFMDHEAHAALAANGGSGRSRDETLGPPLGYVQSKFAIGTPPNPPNASLAGVIWRSARLLARWWLTGAGSPSPFFDDRRAPRVVPRILTVEERRALR